MSNVGVVVSERLARYAFGDGHPFGPDRLAAFVREFSARGLAQRVTVIEPRAATDAELRSFHSAEYLEFVRDRSASGGGLLDAGDTPAFKGVYEAAAGVVGATLAAMEAIMDGECRRAFVPIAGLHHAARNRAAGFCVFNDCGVAIEQLKRSGLKRVAYVDIDAHHGDGVFYAFEHDAAVVFADLHEDGRYLYPGTGAQEETGRGAARAPSSTCRCRRVRTTRPLRRCGRRSPGTWRSSRPSSSSCSAARTASRVIRSRTCASHPRSTAALRASWRSWPSGSATAGCWRSAAAATTAPIWRRPGAKWSRICSTRHPRRRRTDARASHRGQVLRPGNAGR